MADNITVAVQRNSLGQPVNELVTFSDEANNNFTIVGIPGASYNLSGLPGAPTISASEVTSTLDNTIGQLFSTSIQVANPVQAISFTDSLQNTLTILGNPNSIYDLNLLGYLLAIVTTLDQFMSMTYGDSYDNVKHQNIQLVNLE